jgi:cytochrome c-type biogenesis protein CcmF
MAAFAAATSFQRVLYVRTSPHTPRFLAFLAAIFGVTALLFLFNIFLTTDLSYEIVHKYSSADMQWVYKLSGSWAGQAGSMVLWSAMVLVFWAVEEIRWYKKERAGQTPEEEPVEERKRKGRSRKGKRSLTVKQAERKAAPPEGYLTLDLVRGVVMLLAMVLLFATLALDPFMERVTQFPPGGQGLNPALRTPLMAIHPPIVFLSYAMVTIVFGAAIAYLVRKDELWVDFARPWGRMAWFTLTLGIGIGAMWAYLTLGWGGYWAWDPVETSSLLPWVTLTAFLHALHSHGRRGDYTYLAPLLAGLTMFLIFFATFVTRSGVWASVHSYAGASADSAIDRVWEALIESNSLRWIYWSMMTILLLTLVGVGYRFWKAEEDTPMLPERAEDESTFRYLARDRVSMFATIFLLTVSTLLLLIILISAAGGSVSPEEYHARISVFIVPLMAFLVLCMATRSMSKREALIATGLALLAGLALWAINPGDLDPSIAWFGAIIGLFGVAVVMWQPVSIARRKGNVGRTFIRRSGSIMLHLGLAMVFMAYCLSNVPDLSDSQGITPDASVPVGHEEYLVFIEDRTWDQNVGVRERGEYWDDFSGEVRLERDGKEMSTGPITIISEYKYREYGTLGYREEGQVKHMDGEVADSQLSSGHFYVKFQSFRDPNLQSVVVDLYDQTTTLNVWPGLYNDADVLEGEWMRIASSSQTWEGFLRSVDGVGGNVTLFDGEQEVHIPGDKVQRSYRKAYVGLAMTDVYVDMSPVKDVYITILSAKPSEEGIFVARVMVLEVPAMAILWTGMVLMSIGVLLRPLEKYGAVKKDDEHEGEASEKDDTADDMGIDGTDEESEDE